MGYRLGVTEREVISSRKHRWLKDIRRLRRSKEPGRLLVEGPRLLREAVSSRLRLEATLATPAFCESAEGRDLLGRLDRPPLLVEPALLAEVSDVDSPQGILAVALRPAPDSKVLAGADLVLYLDGVQDPGNVGALARVAEAAGAEALVLGEGTARAEHPRAVRGSAGSLFRLPVGDAAGWDAVRNAQQYRWLGLAADGAQPLWSADLSGPLVVVAGGEGAGISTAVLGRLDASVAIPMAGPVESLNVAVATGIVLFERARRVAARDSSVAGGRQTP